VVGYSLPVSENTVLFVSARLYAERRRLGTRAGTRSLGCYRQAILVLRWLLDDRITAAALVILHIEHGRTT
jgi:hypothetical protein